MSLQLTEKLKSIIGGLSQLAEMSQEIEKNKHLINDPKVLIERSESFNKKYEFKAGDLIELKPNMKLKYKYEYGQPLVVAKVLDEPLFESEDNSCSLSFMKPMDIVVGSIADNGDYVEHHMDSRHFEPYTGNAAETTTEQ